MAKNNWLLPDGVCEWWAPEARALEQLRTTVLSWLSACGYELVRPPLMEFVDSLLTGAAEDLDVQTLKVVDQHSGRLMGLRADITPQVARMDASGQRRAKALGDAPGIARLCYAGPVVRARSDGWGANRESLQCGAELYGGPGFSADCEIVQVLLGLMERLGIGDVHIDFGHVGIFRCLAHEAGLSADVETELFEALQRKSAPDIAALLSATELPAASRQRLAALAGLSGGVEVIAQARGVLSPASPALTRALGNLEAVVGEVQMRHEAPLHIDLAELRGYRYHTGLVFSLFVPGHGDALARGGRYDGIGAAFGDRAGLDDVANRASAGPHRPATGFSLDLTQILTLDSGACAVVSEAQRPQPCIAVRPPSPHNDPTLHAKITALRRAGQRVLVCLPEECAVHVPPGCDRVLVKRRGNWVVEAASEAGAKAGTKAGTQRGQRTGHGT